MKEKVDSYLSTTQGNSIPFFGLGSFSCFKLFCAYYRLFNYQKFTQNRQPVCFYSNGIFTSKKWANMSLHTFYKYKRKLLELNLIIVENDHTIKQGTISMVFPTDKGWKLYTEIKNKNSRQAIKNM